MKPLLSYLQRMGTSSALLLLLLLSCDSPGDTETTDPASYQGPIIDLHLHADAIEDFGPDPVAMCIPLSTMIPHYDPRDNWMEVWQGKLLNPACDEPLWSPETNEELVRQFGEQLKKHHAIGYFSGRPDRLQAWQEELTDRFRPTIQLRIGRDELSVDSIRRLVEVHGFTMLGEISNQYAGIAPNDPRMDQYYALAEELDLPVAIHMGSGAPGAPLFMDPAYSPSLSNPLLLEPVLKKYPNLRVSITHYGEPFLDELIAMMYHYPQLYVDLGGIQWCYPREYFYEYHLKKMVYAGFGQRILFSSDAFIWPELISESIAIINEAEFLSLEQKADIFYHNAVRFLRL